MEKLIKLIQEIDAKPIYNKIDLQFPSLMEDNEVQRIKNLVVPKLKIIEEEIDSLFFLKIKGCKSAEEAKAYFDLLQKAQEILAMLFFKENIQISDKLQKFIRDCDRLDDDWLRNSIFNKIKEGTYNYDFMG